MSLDIREGDILIVDDSEYQIKSCAEWSWGPNSSLDLTTITASTKRNPAIANGKIGVPVVNLSSVEVTPIDPVNPDLVPRALLESAAHELLETHADGTDVFYRLILEQLKV